MLRSNFNHGFPPEAWNAAKAEARAIMIERARIRGMISYSELVQHIHAITIGPHDPRLDHLLGEISSDENAAGRGMLTVLVVHKVGDMEPGRGFYKLAPSLGRNTSDLKKCWIDELHRVHREWAPQSVRA
jgi:hypothetical protein